MALYVDDAQNPYGRMKMAHMIADTHAELVQAAEALGLDRWLQHEGTWKEHLDVCQSKRREAIAELKAIPITQKELFLKSKSKRT